MKTTISSFFILILILSLFLSCDDSKDISIPFDEGKYYKQFWMHTKTGHAKDYYIQISLPRSYYEKETRRYPVLYLTDADFCFNMARDLTMVLDWPQREVIVVGIGYGSPERLMELRWPEYSDTPDEYGVRGCIQFMRFIEDRLIPKVETEFRINPHNRTLFGWSWGTIFASNVLEETPLLFHNYILGGGYRDSIYVENLYDKWPDLPVNLYMGMGEHDVRMKDQWFPSYVKALENKGFGGLQLHWDIYPKQAHEIVTIAILLDRGMKWVYTRKPIAPRLRLALKSGGVNEALEVYDRFLTTNPDDFDFYPHNLITFAESLGIEGNNSAQRKILDYVERKYPKRQVTFQIRPKEMPKSDFIYITGNNPVLGNWDLKKVMLQQTETGTWSGTYTLRAGINLEFKITRGSWETQAADSTGSELSNYKEYINSDTVITKVIEKWVDLK